MALQNAMSGSGFGPAIDEHGRRQRRKRKRSYSVGPSKCPQKVSEKKKVYPGDGTS
jgi:hypothetical protein